MNSPDWLHEMEAEPAASSSTISSSSSSSSTTTYDSNRSMKAAIKTSNRHHGCTWSPKLILNERDLIHLPSQSYHQRAKNRATRLGGNWSHLKRCATISLRDKNLPIALILLPLLLVFSLDLTQRPVRCLERSIRGQVGVAGQTLEGAGMVRDTGLPRTPLKRRAAIATSIVQEANGHQQPGEGGAQMSEATAPAAYEPEEEATGEESQVDEPGRPEHHLEAGAHEADELQLEARETQSAMATRTHNGSKLAIVRLVGPEAAQNGTQNVTIDCMFKFDRKLDQRLTIKWFFNDEVEPIYQWIPELNKRVYSDRYERFLDKTYEVSEDVEFMLQAYRWLLAAGSNPNEARLPLESQQQQQQESEIESSRRLLAERLNKLAKLGGRHSRQLLDSLRAALYMEQLDFARYRALRLIRPTTELSGRFTCSVSSLDGDSLHSSELLVYEPAKNFTFTVSRLSSQYYNLTCRANQVFPQPALALFRYRAGPLEQQQLASQASNLRLQHAHRPRLAATLLRQEPVPGTQTQIIVHSNQAPDARSQARGSELANDIAAFDNSADEQHQLSSRSSPKQRLPTVYEISSWALVDESTLSSNVVTQFECLLSIEGTGYEQRQSLSLQKGWHVNSASATSRPTLVSLFSALASLLCLLLALVSSMFIFKILKRHARNRVHQEKGSDASNSERTNSTGTLNTNSNLSVPPLDRPAATLTGRLAHDRGDAVAPHDSTPSESSTRLHYGATQSSVVADQRPRTESAKIGLEQPATDSDGVYRVPEQLKFGTRFVIGPGIRQQQYYGDSYASKPPNSFLATHSKQQAKFFNPSNNTEPLYC